MSDATGKRAFFGNRRGAAAMEFALVVPLFCTMMFGILQYGVLMFVYTAMQDTAREASRKLATGATTASVAASEARDALPHWIPAGSWTIVTTDAAAGATQVSTSISIAAANATVVDFVPMPETLSANAIMRKEA